MPSTRIGTGFEVQGTRQLHDLGMLLAAEGASKRIRASISREIKAAVIPVGPKAKERAREILPRRGGLNEWVASADIGVRTTLKGQYAGVRITARRKQSGRRGSVPLQNIDQGSVRHPVFGQEPKPPLKRNWHWVTQSVEPGWFTKPAEEAAPVVQASLLAVLDDIAKRLTHK